MGTPAAVRYPPELYERPANRFVAGFLGRPAINFLREDDGTWLGVRPEHLHPVAEGGLLARVVSREWHGASQQLQLQTERGLLRWVCDGYRSVGETLRIHWALEHSHRFDAGTGLRLPA